MTEETLNAAEAIAFLKAEGFKVSRSTFYSDLKRPGLIESVGGRYPKKSLLKYAKKKPLPFTDKRPPKSATENLDLKNRLLLAKAEEQEMRNKLLAGKYVERSQVELNQAMAIGVFDASLKTMFRTTIMDAIIIVGGKHEKGHLLYDFYLKQVEHLLDELGHLDEIKIVVRRNPNGDWCNQCPYKEAALRE